MSLAKLLEKLKRLDKDATPGPWVADAEGIIAPKASTIMPGYQRIIISPDYISPAAMDLISYVRNALPVLIEIIEKQHNFIERCKWDRFVNNQHRRDMAYEITGYSDAQAEKLLGKK